MRWRIAERGGQLDDAPRLRAADQCSDVGILAIEIITFERVMGIGDVDINTRQRPCFPLKFDDPDASVAGPPGLDGEYTIVARAIRRDGIGWIDRDPEVIREELEDAPSWCLEEGQCFDGFLSCDCRFVEIGEEETILIDDVLFAAPPECEDGIDGDLDGLVDAADPGCRTAGVEDADVGVSQFEVAVSVLDHNPNVLCTGLGITGWRYVLDGDEENPILSPCTFETVFFTAELEPGEHTLAISAHGPGGPLTRVDTRTLTVDDAGQGFFPVDVDFAASEFIEPIVAGAQLPIGFAPFEGAATVGCNGNGARTSISDVRIWLLDAHGDTITPPVLTNDGEPLDGTPFTCPPGIPLTEQLEWGGYLVEVQALSPEGEICYTNVGTPFPAAPSLSRTLRIPRAELLADSCRDCADNSDCGGRACIDGVCR